MDYVEKEGLSIPEAVFSAARELGIDEKDAQVQVLSAPGARRVKVRVGRPGVVLPVVDAPLASSASGEPRAPRPSMTQATPAEQGSSPVQRSAPNPGQAGRAAADLERLLVAMGTPGSVECVERSGNLVLNVQSSQHENLLIGRRGQTVDALQTLINEFMAHREGDASLFVVVDVADYRGRQEQRLVEKALALAAQVLDAGGEANMGPLSSAERRVVHLALKSVAGVESFSVGQGGTKKLVIQKKA
ncbi:MAG: protein jag [bacterium]